MNICWCGKVKVIYRWHFNDLWLFNSTPSKNIQLINFPRFFLWVYTVQIERENVAENLASAWHATGLIDCRLFFIFFLLTLSGAKRVNSGLKIRYRKYGRKIRKWKTHKSTAEKKDSGKNTDAKKNVHRCLKSTKNKDKVENKDRKISSW